MAVVGCGGWGYEEELGWFGSTVGVGGSDNMHGRVSRDEAIGVVRNSHLFVITSECGIKIPVTGVDEIENRIAEAVEWLYRDEAARQKLALGALERIRDYSWDKKALIINEIYEKVTEGGTDGHR